MNLAKLSTQLTKVFNSLGNKWLTDNFEIEPFDFRVYLRKGDPDDTANYVAEVYTERPIPFTIEYKEGKSPNWADGIHNSVLSNYLKGLVEYVESFGGFGKILRVELMDISNEKFVPKRIQENSNKKKISLDRLVDQFIKPIYPKVDKIVLQEENDDITVVKIYVNDDSFTKDNMYSKGLDPDYLVDFHLAKFFPYLNLENKMVLYSVIKPDGDVIQNGFHK